MPPENQESQNKSFLIITHDKDVFDPLSPTGNLIADIRSIVSELHIIYLGTTMREPQKIYPNTFLYTARRIPFFSFFTVYQVILAQLAWKRHFRPAVIISLGDEISLAKRFSQKYRRPLYVFYSYLKVLGRGSSSLRALVDAYPERVFVPNSYVGKAIETYPHFRSADTQIRVLGQYIDVPGLEKLFSEEHFGADASTRNRIFTVISFPHNVSIHAFKMIRVMSRAILSSITQFQFLVVVKPRQLFYARLLKRIFKIPIILHEENETSMDLLRTARLMLYFDSVTTPYEPILYSFVAGCPVLSSGDEYSKIILFNSGFEEYAHLQRDGVSFGIAVRKFINDPYLYTKYKMNCVGFAEAAFTMNKDGYMALLKDGLLQD